MVVRPPPEGLPAGRFVERSPPVEIKHERGLDQVARSGEGRPGQIPPAGPPPPVQGRADGNTGAVAGQNVYGPEMRVLLRSLHAAAEAEHDAGGSLGQVIVAEMIRLGPPGRPSEGIQLGQDQGRIHAVQAPGIQPEPVTLLVGAIERDDIGPPDQPIQHLPAAPGSEVEQDALLAPVCLESEHDGVPGIHGWKHGLNVDHLRTEPGKRRGDGRPCDHIRQVQDPDALKPAGRPFRAGRFPGRLGEYPLQYPAAIADIRRR